MLKQVIKVQNKYGVHARPAAMLVKLAKNFRSDFKIVKDDLEINGKSIMGVMMLAAEFGAEIEIIADGEDEDYLVEEVMKLFASKFNED